MHLLDLITLRLVKEGFGSYAEVEAMPVTVALHAFHYIGFLADYQETYSEINKPTS